MQAPSEDLSQNAKIVYENLAAEPESTRSLDVITDTLDGQLTGQDVEVALHELERAGRAAEPFAGWSVLT